MALTQALVWETNGSQAVPVAQGRNNTGLTREGLAERRRERRSSGKIHAKEGDSILGHRPHSLACSVLQIEL